MNEKPCSHIVYLTTDLTNGMVYAGVHTLADTWKSRNYLGSGYYLNNAVKAHGRKNFSREILWWCDSKKAALELEGLLVDRNWLKSPMTYNLLLGGGGKKENFDQSTKDKISQSLKEYWNVKEHREKRSKKSIEIYKNNPFWVDYHKSEKGLTFIE